MYPRHCTRTDRIPGCTEHADSELLRQAGSGSFWVAAPAEDINADLRSLVDPNHFISSIAPTKPGIIRAISSRQMPSVRLSESGITVENAGCLLAGVSVYSLKGELLGSYRSRGTSSSFPLPPVASGGHLVVMRFADGSIASAKAFSVRD